MKAAARLRALKALHSLIWAFFASCVIAIPLAAWVGRFDLVLVLTGLVIVECLALALNRGECPLQAIAMRYTDDRSPNFDIYLPRWLAGRTKIIFGPLFGFGLIFSAALLWMRG